MLRIGEREVFTTFAKTPALMQKIVFTLRDLPVSLLRQISNLSSRAIHPHAHGKQFLYVESVKNAIVCFGAPNADDNKDQWAGTNMESQPSITAMRPLFLYIRDNEALEQNASHLPTVGTVHAFILFKRLTHLVLQQALSDASNTHVVETIDRAMGLLDPVVQIWNTAALSSGSLLPVTKSGAQFMSRWARYFGMPQNPLSLSFATTAFVSPAHEFSVAKRKLWDVDDSIVRALPMVINAAVGSVLVHDLHDKLSLHGEVAEDMFQLVNFAILVRVCYCAERFVCISSSSSVMLI